jgi:hypothetical protein
MASGKRNDPKQQEREERGWWSLRFQQVLRELQRENVVPACIFWQSCQTN